MANDKVKFGVIGAGGIARRKTIPGMLAAKNCRLVAVMDPIGIDQIAAEFKVSKAAYATEQELLADPGSRRSTSPRRSTATPSRSRWRPRPASTSCARSR